MAIESCDGRVGRSKKKTCQVPIENLENQIDGNLAIMKWEGEGEYELVHKFFFYLDGLVVFFN